MTDNMHQSPFNALPAVVWLLALPVIASEAAFALAQAGLMGQGAGLRLSVLRATAFYPEILQYFWDVGGVNAQAARIVAYPFAHASFTQALFVVAFTLALGNLVAGTFRPWAVAALYLGSAAGAAVAYTLFAAWWGRPVAPLIGGFPAVYGLVGAFTFLLFTRLSAVGAGRLRAFSLIGMLMLFQLIFGLVLGMRGFDWVAELAGFACGFGLSFLLAPGGPARIMANLRRR